MMAWEIPYVIVLQRKVVFIMKFALVFFAAVNVFVAVMQVQHNMLYVALNAAAATICLVGAFMINSLFVSDLVNTVSIFAIFAVIDDSIGRAVVTAVAFFLFTRIFNAVKERIERRRQDTKRREVFQQHMQFERKRSEHRQR